MTVKIDESVQLDLLDLLETRGLAACKKLNAICSDPHFAHIELRRKFLGAIRDIERVTIERLARARGAFEVHDGVLRISETPIAHLLTVIVNDIEHQIDSGAVAIDAVDVPDLLERVFAQYIFHELRHRTQGLTQHSDVQALKALGAADLVADYDVLADRDAACAVATVYAKDGTRNAYLSTFKEALFFSTNYFFQVFPIPSSRPDKIARAMSVLFMAARLAVRDLNDNDTVEENSEFPLDAPLKVTISTKDKMLAVHLGEPSPRLLGFANDDDGVGDLMDQITHGQFNEAIETSTRIMGRMKLLS